MPIQVYSGDFRESGFVFANLPTQSLTDAVIKIVFLTSMPE